MYSVSSKETYQLSRPEGDEGRGSHGLTTFSAENEGFNGASSTAAHLITEENGTKRNSNHLQDEDTL
ncbi:hypothetical protein OS493_021058 [Desmophyllum pertusum]|uniref:Uncharacterized protein n=1 Tax=Desmophyllum pertusum TaxID=174260 RepID=A0A9X0A0B4_9CNID|nr:hypothetical protein OS493_021058 [Desmophyllum pertusum]